MDTKRAMVEAIIEAMQHSYAEDGCSGDFEDARRYLLSASDEEIKATYQRWFGH